MSGGTTGSRRPRAPRAGAARKAKAKPAAAASPDPDPQAEEAAAAAGADPRALAERFLDLWQRQAAALMDDPLVAQGMAQWLAQLPPMLGAGAAAGAGSGGSGGEGDGGTDGAAGGGGGAGAGAAAMAGAAAAAPGAQQPDPGELLRRLAACEERLDRLEALLSRGSR